MLPSRIRGPVAAIYAYARRADDLADEGNHSPEHRLAELDEMERALRKSAVHEVDDGDPVFVALGDTIQRFALPLQPLVDLLDAFRQDVTVLRYQNFGELMGYCRRSANPVGRLLLHLFDAGGARNLGYSDAICSALQLINFLQDVGPDFHDRGRIYLPLEEMARFGVREEDIAAEADTAETRALVAYQADRALRLLRSGAPLGRALKGRVGLELRMIVAGGEKIARAKLSREQPAFSRPTLRPGDWIELVGRGLWLGLRPAAVVTPRQ